MLIDVVRACVKKRNLHFIGTVIAFLPSLFAQSQWGPKEGPQRDPQLGLTKGCIGFSLRRLRFLSAARSGPIKPEAQGIAQP